MPHMIVQLEPKRLSKFENCYIVALGCPTSMKGANHHCSIVISFVMFYLNFVLFFRCIIIDWSRLPGELKIKVRKKVRVKAVIQPKLNSLRRGGVTQEVDISKTLEASIFSFHLP